MRGEEEPSIPVGGTDASVPVVILKFAPWMHHGGLGVARTAGRLGAKVYWIHDGRKPAATTSRYVSARASWNAAAPASETLEFLGAWARRIGPGAILIPVDDIAAIFVADNAADLRRSFLFPDQPAGLARSLCNKMDLYGLCKESGVDTPDVALVESVQDVDRFIETATFPVVVKRIAAWVADDRRNIDSVTITESAAELAATYRRLHALGESSVLLQEYIPGGPESVWMFNGYFDERSECLVGFTGKKIRQMPPLTGWTTLGICLPNEAVRRSATDFLRSIGYRGVVDMGYRYDRRDGKYKLLDVNPRVGSTFRLFVDSSGMDVVRALYLDLTGQPVSMGSPRHRRKWIVEHSDVWSSLQYARQGRLTLTQWLRSLIGIQEAAWFARDDPRPFVAMTRQTLVELASRTRRRALVAVIRAVRSRRRWMTHT